ncbi:antifreeze protein [Pseudorhodobacter sp. W20_MBD10_FR17]|uniref:antifreeze protein n=1 Tax=Pseudorhodobacter sp. W20_MBD10_FR17 TaxID=3240266 RepID=UPI003F9E27AF
MTKVATLFDNAIEMSMMMIEAQSVIHMRLMGMAGLWKVCPQENSRMVTEKLEAMMQATSDAGQATLRGGSADEITAAAIAPMRNATRANSERLGKNGMKWG